MTLPFTYKMLVDWAGAQMVKDAESLVDRALVIEARFEPPLLRGSVLWNNREIQTGLKMQTDGTVENLCPCYANRERGIVCAHAIAVALAVLKRASDPERQRRQAEELRRAARLASCDESLYIRRVPAGTPGALPASLRLTMDRGWLEGCASDRIPLVCDLVYQQQSMPLDQVPRHLPFTFTQGDETLLYVLEDIYGGPAPGRLELTRADFANLLRLLAGQKLAQRYGPPITVNCTPLVTHLRMDLNPENGAIILTAHTEIPLLRPGETIRYVVHGKSGWVCVANNIWPLENVLPEPYHPIYDGPITLSRPAVLSFIRQELLILSKYARVESDLSPDLFTVEPAVPAFRLVIRGSAASLSAMLYARYGDIELIAAKPDPKAHFSIPADDDLLKYYVRNLEAEKHALTVLAKTGLSGETGDSLTSIVGTRAVLNFLGEHIPALRRRGWNVEIEGRVAPYFETLGFATPVVRIAETGAGWFDVSFEFEDIAGGSLSRAAVQLALEKNQAFIEVDERVVLIDADAVRAMLDVFVDCATTDSAVSGHFRMSNLYAAFVQASLNALDGVDVEAPPAWRTQAERSNRKVPLEPVELPARLDQVLRPYQKEGVAWLRFLECNGFCGLLADEMGLGKTVQTLAWLALPRYDPRARGKPALIVCPTSIVDNWAEEAARFVPDKRVLTISGPARHERWSEIEKADIVITSYALLRRDLERYLGTEFAVVVLDEAQHIKNRSTQNAVAAKQLRCLHRLVLTGTPVENSVSDLWSIMDFLMPGYLGSHESFRRNYELPIARQDADAQVKLRRKLHPFLLRRLKTEVARDLPPKIERIAGCTLTPDQQLVYSETLKAARRRLDRLVAERGLNAARLDILAALTKLRQICCHLDLLKLPDLRSKAPSAKMDLFFELLDEALDAGHRVLVFSQFVSMLQILRRSLEERGLAYSYLDGSTKDRMTVIHAFNTQREIPVFLISLKAGGTGLNLTGADMVIHFDPWWNPAVEDQATDRAYRIGQKRTVYSVKLITRGTIEEKVLNLQQRKQAVINATIANDEQLVKTLSWAEIEELLSL